MKLLLTMIIGLGLIMPLQSVAHAQASGKFVVPCAVPFYRELDFIVGDWQVFHKDTGKLAGYDRIGRTLRGCAIQQSWISLDDHFSSEYVPFRMYGKSLTAFNGSKWVHMWVDNNAGVQILEGGPDNDRFVLKSKEPVGGFEYELSWKKGENDRIENLHRRRPIDGGDWEVLYHWLYVKNVNQSLLPDDEEMN
ncbi:hypothetical protein [Pseudemcibacter aquimaris]|uniref:hypothetical protein n=1 Tax=Pseudemcibacter aquimaris TaxID=2857064 RepID=UPI002013B61A|nr:hypothetical protein [Pseudemcibacter aquimaris]MCC3862129.1 hypothetical protein [Pseudemcibacter aquimaris]WDU58882.1 hypothetical protein KW060_01165 [Pseudemcibacter aquimaris]